MSTIVKVFIDVFDDESKRIEDVKWLAQGTIYPDVIETHGDDNLGHGAQKPVELYVNLLKRSVRPGDAVLDCFGGTGTVLPAAHELQCRATYVEKDENCYGIALKLLGELK